MDKLITLMLCVVSLCIGTAQKSELKWGKVSDEHLKMTSYADDPEADALILGDVNFVRLEIDPTGFVAEYRRHRRVKILKESGYDWADVSIGYRSKDRYEDISSLKAQIILPSGEKINVSKKDIFKEKTSDNYTEIKFTFPNLQEGAVVEWQYTLSSKRIAFLNDWYFQRSIPTLYSHLVMDIPEWFEYVKIGNQIEKMTSNTSTKTGRFGNVDGVNIEVLDYKMYDVPALKQEDYITNMLDYYPSISFQLSAYTLPGELRKSFMGTWPKLAEELMSGESIGKHIKRKGTFKKVIDAGQESLKAGENQMEVVRNIHTFLTKQVEWDGNYSIYPGPSLNECFEKKSANTAEFNLMMLALLKEAGIEAMPALLSTRSHGYPMPVYPVLNQFNHLIVKANVDGKDIFLDISNKLRPPELPDVDALNGTVWILDEANPTWENIQGSGGSDTYFIKAVLDEEGTLTGTFVGSYSGYNAIPERRKYEKDKSGKHWQKRLESKYPEIEVENVTFENMDILEKRFKDEFNFTIEEAVTDAGDQWYFSPILYTGLLDENPFKLEERTYPIDFPYPITERYILDLEIPEGYVIEEIPQPINLSLMNKDGGFKFNIEKKGENNVQLVSSFNIKKTIFDPEEYKGLKGFFNMAVEKYSEQLVIKKTE